MTFTGKHILLLFWLFLTCSNLFAQGEHGLAHGNYNVTEGIRINPARAVDPVPFFDFHVLGGNAFIDNNYIFLPDKEFNLFAAKFPNEAKDNFTLTKKHGQLEVNVLGPAFNYPFRKHTIGISTAIRNYTSIRDIPFHLAKNYFDEWENIDFHNQSFEGDEFRINSLTWEELGVHFGTIVYQEGFEMINVAGNLKYILGAGGFSFKAQNFDYTLIDQNNIAFTDVDAEYTATVPGTNQGRGWGLDLGFEYKKMLEPVNGYIPHDIISDCKRIDYKYRFGVSLLDLGYINFTKSSFYRKIEDGQVQWDDFSDFNADNTRDFINDFDERFAPYITNEKTSYTAYLPAALSVQYDYNFENNYFINATALVGVRRKNKFGAERLDHLAITPRYEKPHFEIAAPVTINRFLHPGVGFAMRFWYLSFGTNNIVPYLIGDVYGMDAYFHIKWKFLKSKRCDVELLRPAWRVNDCTAPRIDARTKKKFKKDNKSRRKRDKRRRKRYSGA